VTRPPKVGQILVTDAGEQFCVSNVVLAAELDDPEIDPEFFLVELIEGNDLDRLDVLEEQFTPEEFQSWCEGNGVRL
jgi:hypothetical protein